MHGILLRVLRLCVQRLLLGLRRRLYTQTQLLQRLLHRRLYRQSRRHHRAQVRRIGRVALHHEDVVPGRVLSRRIADQHMVDLLQALLAGEHGQAGGQALAGLVERTAMLGVQGGHALADLLVEAVLGMVGGDLCHGDRTVEVESFVDAAQIDPRYYEKPYLLVPGKKAEKGYVLLRETLRSTGRVGIARVVVRTREYLCAVMPQQDALVLMILRYPQELVDPEDYKLPTGKLSDYRITSKETAMAEQLIESMAGDWDPSQYHDEFRERLQQVLNKRIKSKGGTTRVEDEPAPREDASTNVVDFMALLQKSLDANKRTPAKKTATRKAPAKKAAKKTAKKAVKKTTRRKAG